MFLSQPINAYQIIGPILHKGSERLVGNRLSTAHYIDSLDRSDDNSLTFCTYRRGIDTSSLVAKNKPAITICDLKLEPLLPDPGDGTYIFVDNAKSAFNEILLSLNLHGAIPRISYSNVTVYDCVSIGDNVSIYPGTVIGHPGLAPMRDYHDDSKLVQFKDIGKVIIGNNVYIGANCAIARAPLDATIIEDNVRIGNMNNIGHNAHVKKGAIITSMCMIARGTIGENAWLSPGCTVVPGVNIGANAFVGTGSVVTKDVPDNIAVAGNPARGIGFAKQIREREGLI